jgi:hypothetical protein
MAGFSWNGCVRILGLSFSETNIKVVSALVNLLSKMLMLVLHCTRPECVISEAAFDYYIQRLRAFRRAWGLGQWFEGLWVKGKWVVGLWVVGLWVSMEKSKNTMLIS